MAFGKSMKVSKQAVNTGDGEQVKYNWHWIPTQSGNRLFRILPAIEQGVAINEPVSEVRWLETWYDVMVNGTLARRRIILDWQAPWSSPMWKYVSENFEKGSKERKAFKQKFGINVYDRTPVIYDAEGEPIYPNDKNVYNISAKGKVVSVAQGTPLPHNKIRILEGSAGDIGGRHLLQQVADLMESGISDNEGNPRGLHEFDIRLRTTGEGINTNRSVRDMGNFAPLADEVVFAPRYDLDAWATPWPNETLQRLVDGEDFNDIVEEYGLKLFPELTDSLPVPTAANVTTVQVDEDDELFADEEVAVVKKPVRKGAKFD